MDIILEGGGTKGVAYVGAVRAFEESGIIVRKAVGTSAGAIAALIILLGYTSAEMEKIMSEQVNGKPLFASFFDTPTKFDQDVIENSALMQEFEDINVPFVPDAIEKKIDRAIIKSLLKGKQFRRCFSLFECGGLFAGDAILEWLKTLIVDKGKSADLLLKDLPNLTVISADNTTSCKLVLDAKNSPDMPVVWAVRASMSIPFVWQSVIWQKEWGLYQGRDLSGHELVDGGLCSNLALDQIAPQQGIALLLDEDLAVPGVPAESITTSKTLRRIQRLVETVRAGNDRAVHAEYESMVCHIPCQGYSIIEYMSNEKQSALIKAAYQATSAYLDNL